MRNPHQVIIHYVCEVISWESIVFNNHLVVDNIIFENYFAMHQVFKLCFAFGDLHSNDERFTLCLLFSDLIRIVAMRTKPVIHSFGVLLTSNLHSHFSQTLSCAEARIRIAILFHCEKHTHLPQAESLRTCRRFSVVVTRSKVL